MAIDITLLANVKGFLRGTKDAAEGLDDVGYSLDRLAKDGDDSIERLEGKFKQLAQQADRTGDDMGDGIKRGTDKATEGVNEFRDEANSTARESAASFDGSAESIIDSFQEIAANAFAGFGPAGAIAGLAMAAGIGLAVKGFQDNEEAAEKLREKVGELTQQFIESGEIGELSLEGYIDAIKELAAQTDEAETSLVDIKNASGDNVRTMQDLAEAIGGLTGDYDSLIDANNERLQQIAVEKQQVSSVLEWNQERIDQLGEQRRAIEETNKSLKEQAEAEVLAAEAAQAANEIGLPALEARAAMTEMVNAAYDDAAASATDYLNQETGFFDVSAYLAAMQEREQALKDYQATLATSGLSEDAKAFLNEQGYEAASLMLEGYASADQATKNELNRIWAEAGREGSGAADKEIKNAFKTPYEATIKPKVSLYDAQKALDDFAAKQREIRIRTIFVDREGREVG